MKKIFTAAVFLVSTFPVLAGNAPLSVSSQGTFLFVNPGLSLPVWQLTLTGTDDDITIQGLTLNRGNCLISLPGRGQNVNKRLQFGQSFSFTTPSNDSLTKCKPLELTVQTSKGSFTFNWK